MKNIVTFFTSIILLQFFPIAVFSEEPPKITVYKSPSCGCCSAWVDYMRDNNFSVESIDLNTMNDIKQKVGIKAELQSCHTALIGGYVIEGHVPAQDVTRLLEEQPDIVGLTAPGMPQQSPGMNSIIPKNYTVYSFDKAGNVEVFSAY